MSGCACPCAASPWMISQIHKVCSHGNIINKMTHTHTALYFHCAVVRGYQIYNLNNHTHLSSKHTVERMCLLPHSHYPLSPPWFPLTAVIHTPVLTTHSCHHHTPVLLLYAPPGSEISFFSTVADYWTFQPAAQCFCLPLLKSMLNTLEYWTLSQRYLKVEIWNNLYNLSPWLILIKKRQVTWQFNMPQPTFMVWVRNLLQI